MSAHFTPAFFTFMRGLKRHNSREWFADHRARYLADVEAPMLAFIAGVAPHLKKISPAFIADPRRTGGSLFRIYRDTRFSPDKSPFKTWSAARFPHEASRKGENVPAFYVHLQPGDNFGGGGLYHADQPVITKIRQRIVAAPRAWADVRKAAFEIHGETLKRAPVGYDPAHRFVDDLKRKDFYMYDEYAEADVLRANFLDRYVESLERGAVLMQFLTKALDLRW